MRRKYIRHEKDSTEEAENEWAHITGIYGEQKKIEAKDALDVQDRSITFGNQEGPKTKYEIVKESARDAMDAAGNTGQYIRFVNAHIDNQKKQLDRIKQLKEKFDREVNLLQSHKVKLEKLDGNSLSESDIKTITEYLHHMLIEKGLTKTKLDNLRKEIGSIERELQKQEKQIEDVSEQLKKKKLLMDEKKAKMDSMKEELSALVAKYGIENLSKVLGTVNPSNGKQ